MPRSEDGGDRGRVCDHDAPAPERQRHGEDAAPAELVAPAAHRAVEVGRQQQRHVAAQPTEGPGRQRQPRQQQPPARGAVQGGSQGGGGEEGEERREGRGEEGRGAVAGGRHVFFLRARESFFVTKNKLAEDFGSSEKNNFNHPQNFIFSFFKTTSVPKRNPSVLHVGRPLLGLLSKKSSSLSCVPPRRNRRQKLEWRRRSCFCFFGCDDDYRRFDGDVAVDRKQRGFEAGQVRPECSPPPFARR